MRQPLIDRILLGLDRPPLISAAEKLCEAYLTKPRDVRPTLEMTNCLVVVPTTRARHRLIQLLATTAMEREAVFSPPEITTLGNFPEYLYVPEKLLATDLAQQIAWARALEETPDDEIKRLTGRSDVDGQKDWRPLARLLSKLHTRLAADGWSFNSVAREVGQLGNFLANELQRWEVLREIQKRYYRTLKKADLWDRQAARNWIAAGSRPEVNEQRCRTDKEVILVATADINRSIAGMLAQLDTKVTVMVATDESQADRFDVFGNLISEKWLAAEVAVPDEKILFVDSPSDQAVAAADFISHLDKNYATDEVTIGVPSEDLLPQLQRSVSSLGLPHRNLAGKPLAETSPVRLMLACRDYFRSQDFESFAILARHPDMYRWISEKLLLIDADAGDKSGESRSLSSWIDAMDRYQNNKLPDSIRVADSDPFGDPEKIKKHFHPDDRDSKRRATVEAQNTSRLNTVHKLVASLLRPLDGPARKIADWTEPWSEILLAVYGDRELDRDLPEDQQILLACQAMHAALANHRHVPVEFGATCLAAEALEWAVDAASEERVVDPPSVDAIEFAGWLDLPLDDAPVLAIVGMNDEHVPASEFGHQFLPNKLCEQLGILDNDRRFARDVYALTVITSVRDDYLLIAGRNDAAKDPLKPSRLFFTQDEETSAQRAYSFFSFEGKEESSFWLYDKKLAQKNTVQQFEIPKPHLSEPLTSLTVTRFRDYIKCPFRFYLNSVMRLETVSDDWSEMSGGTFGDLAHDVLQSFAESDHKDSVDDDEIYDWLSKELDRQAKRRFPGSRLPALRIQLEQLRQRFLRFAPLQAQQRKDGWRIVSCEELLEHQWMVDKEPFVIRGKIDRVDQNELTGKVAVWDYKTSDAGKNPKAAHFKNKKWIDLQLPLYRHLLKEVDVLRDADLSDVVLGYILLPKKLDDIAFAAADWDSSQLDFADRTAFDCIRNIRAGVFGPPAEQPPEFSQDFEGICQDLVFERSAIVAGQWGDKVEEAPPW